MFLVIETSIILANNINWLTAPDNYNDSQQRNADSTSANQNSAETLEESDEASAKQDELKRHLRTMTNKNQQLEAECAQLKRLLKDYETGLESATSSMRLQVVRDLFITAISYK
jgi:predicted RNase H-like nuclease (RuvC/YqgF family)